jgi:hypothetical protein
MVPKEGGWRRWSSVPSSYTDAIKAGSKLDGAGARDVRLVEVAGRRPPSRPQTRAPASSPGQVEMFKERRRR